MLIAPEPNGDQSKKKKKYNVVSPSCECRRELLLYYSAECAANAVPAGCFRLL